MYNSHSLLVPLYPTRIGNSKDAFWPKRANPIYIYLYIYMYMYIYNFDIDIYIYISIYIYMTNV